MTKKGPGWDQRRDADEDESVPADSFRVDRVFDNAATGRIPRSPAPQTQPPPRRAKPVTLPPRPAGEAADTELALRRQLSRLQRQLADAQRELANKDDELASEAENRLAITTAHDKLLEDIRERDTKLDELVAYQNRVQGVEKRLQETAAAADELAHSRDLELDQRLAALARVREVEAALSDAQNRWSLERGVLEAQHAAEMERIEAERKTAAEAAETALASMTARLQKAQEDQLTQLRESHEKSLALLRGELEPKALEARSLAEERSRLNDEIAALKTESAQALTERDELHARELAQQVESHTAGQAAAARVHASEVARLTAERDNLSAALDQAKQSTSDREKLVEQTMSALRDGQKQLQREVTETKEAVARLETDNKLLDERLAAAVRDKDLIGEEARELRGLYDTAEREARENALDRQRFIAYLEEGLAMLGAIPPHEGTGAHAAPDDATATSETFSVSFSSPASTSETTETE